MISYCVIGVYSSRYKTCMRLPERSTDKDSLPLDDKTVRELMIFSSTGDDLEKQGPCAQSMHMNYNLQVDYERVYGRPRHTILTAVQCTRAARLYHLLKIAQLRSGYVDVTMMYSVLD